MENDHNGSLDSVRARIDALDRQLLEKFSERARLAETVGRIKREAARSGEQATPQFYRPEREAAVLRGIREANRGPLDDDTVAWLFREVMSACLALEQPLSVACLGPAGTFSEQAVIRAFGHAAHVVPEPGIAEVFRAVQAGSVDYGVVPIENSTEGSVALTLDALAEGDAVICGEVTLAIRQQLLGRAESFEAARTAARRVVSHVQSLAQCREWLDGHLPGVERVAVASNGEAARLAAEDPGLLAIGPELAAERYGLGLLARNIEDRPHNSTRFVVIGREPVPPSGDDKTSLLLSTDNRPGALAEVLRPLAEAGLSMTRIESRPARVRAWEYVFFIDVAGHAEDPDVARAIDRMRAGCAMLRVLGAYPCGRL
ncbi:MAG: prephenate dehydratase [Halothiobacillaceae bacterium]